MLIDLSVPHHQQDTDVYCGAACAQMVLASIGAGILGQDPLYTDARNHTAELSSWYNPPDGLQWLMNDRRPVGFGGWFALYSLATEDAQSRKLVWTLRHYGVAPIALVYGGDHWLVVRGCDISAAPSSSSDVGYSINSFDVNNPWPPLSDATGNLVTPPPPPHSNGDGCGTGGNRGVANENISYATWKSSYMTANVYGSLWNGRFVSVCDPDPPADQPGELAYVNRPFDGAEIIDPGTAAELAISGAKQFGLMERRDWTVLRSSKPADPVLVQRLDRNDSFYYLVPFGDGNGEVRAAVSVDARFGNYRQAINAEGGTPLTLRLTEDEILRNVVERPLKLSGRQGRLTVRKEAFCLYPTLVWRPCLESLSPYYPFHMITVGNQRIYVRVDGRVFTRLHTHIPGI